MKTCDLKEVISLPSKIFSYTGIKTCILYFVKKRETADVIGVSSSETKIKLCKKFKMIEEHATEQVSFYDHDFTSDTKKLVLSISIDDISKRSYSLNVSEYLESDTTVQGGVVMKTLREICTFLPPSKRLASYGKPEGAYPFYTSSQVCKKYCDTYDYEEECLIIGTGGTANIKCDKKFSCSNHNQVIVVKNGMLKYVYYYLASNIELLQAGFRGAGLQNISKEFIKDIKIPYPTAERQQKFIDTCDAVEKEIQEIQNNINNLEAEIEHKRTEAKNLFNFLE
jgi:type I restriction-modification system DNA methylase subunit